MANPKCPICGKRIKENADGDNRYCQGHSFLDKNKKHDGRDIAKVLKGFGLK